jgi:hypothetical protein
MREKISVFCIWRDSGELIHKTLKQLDSLENLDCFDFSFYFYENDSVDNTAEILKNWLSRRRGKLMSEKIGAPKFGSTTDPQRMAFLCECRNKCKKLAGDNDSEYSLLIDSDIEFNSENLILQLRDLLELDGSVMITANVRQNIPDYVSNSAQDSYYDVYAFRDLYGNDGLYWSDCPFIRKSDRIEWMLGKPIITMSSFGGFALIKSNIFNKVSWHSDFHCDHVNMCYDISRYGSIYINPRSKVYVNLDLTKYDLESFKNCAKRQVV